MRKNDIFADVDKDMLTRVFINLISNAITYGNEMDNKNNFR